MANATVGTASIGLRVNSRQFESGLNRANAKWSRFVNQMCGNEFSSRMNDRFARLQEEFTRQLGRRLRPSMRRIDEWFDNGGFDRLTAGIRNFGNGFVRIAPAVGAVGAALGAMALAVASVVAEGKLLVKVFEKLKPIAEIFVSFVKSTAQLGASMQQTKQSFKTLVGEVQGNDLVDWIQNFADVTPFNFEGLTNSTRQMIQFGFSVEQSKKALQLIGDTVAATTGKMENVDRIAYVMGRTLALNRVYTRNVQMLINDGFRGWDALAEHLGKSVEEVMKMTHRGEIDGVTALNAWFKYMQKYSGGMDKLSKTMAGMLSTVEDEWEQFKRTFGTTVTAPLLERVLPYFIAGIRWLQQQLPKVARIAERIFPIIGKSLLNIAGYIYTIAKNIANSLLNGRDIAEVVFNIVNAFKFWHNLNAHIINTFHVMYLWLKSNFDMIRGVYELVVATVAYLTGDKEGASLVFEDAIERVKQSWEDVQNMFHPLVPFFDTDRDYTQDLRNTGIWQAISQLADDFRNQHIDIFGNLNFEDRGNQAGTEFMEGLQEALESRKDALKSTMDFMKDTVSSVIDKLKSNYQDLGKAIDEVNGKFDVFRQVGLESYAIFKPNSNKANISENEYMNNPNNIAEAYKQIMSEKQKENNMYATVGSYIFGKQYVNTNNELASINSTLNYIKNILGDNSSNMAINQIPIDGYDDLSYSGGF